MALASQTGRPCTTSTTKGVVNNSVYLELLICHQNAAAHRWLRDRSLRPPSFVSVRFRRTSPISRMKYSMCTTQRSRKSMLVLRRIHSTTATLEQRATDYSWAAFRLTNHGQENKKRKNGTRQPSKSGQCAFIYDVLHGCQFATEPYRGRESGGGGSLELFNQVV